VEALGVHGRPHGGVLDLFGQPDLTGAEPERATDGAEAEQVPGAEGDEAAFLVDPVRAWAEGFWY
jgi:hypothetical protein